MSDLDSSLSQFCPEGEPNVHFFKDELQDAARRLPSGQAPASHKISWFEFGLNPELFIIKLECAGQRRRRNCPSDD